MKPAGLVLAGGRGSRLGAAVAKPLVDLGGTTPLRVALDRLLAHCDPVAISANDRDAFEGFGHAVLSDTRPERLGPLAGIEAAALALRASGASHLLTLPGDTPFLPLTVVPGLAARCPSRVRVASFRGRLHPTVALWPLAALGFLSAELDRPDASRSVMAVLERIGFEPVAFEAEPGAPGGDPFFNVNTPQDLETACRHLASALRTA